MKKEIKCKTLVKSIFFKKKHVFKKENLEIFANFSKKRKKKKNYLQIAFLEEIVIGKDLIIELLLNTIA